MPFIALNQQAGKDVNPGYHARAVLARSKTFMYRTVTEGSAVLVHHHHEQVAHLFEGKFERTADGANSIPEAGTIAVTHPFVPHGGSAVTACRMPEIFLPEREDYKFS